MNTRKAINMIKRAKDINDLPLSVLTAASVRVQKRLRTEDERFGMLAVCRDVNDSVYLLMDGSDREDSSITVGKCTMVPYCRKQWIGGEPERCDESELADAEPGRDYFWTGVGVWVGSPAHVRNVTEKEYKWLADKMGKYRRVDEYTSALD